jgi:hypothetical protein
MFEFTDMEWTCYVHVCVFIKTLWRGGGCTRQQGYTLKLVKATVVRALSIIRAHLPSLPCASPSPPVCAPSLPCAPPRQPFAPPSLPCAPAPPIVSRACPSIPFVPSLPPYAPHRFSSKFVVEIHLTFAHAMSAYSINGG